MPFAILVSLVLVLAAPLIGEGRRYAAARLSPEQYLWLVNGLVAGAVVLVGVAVSRIRDGWLWRYGLIAVAAVAAVAFTWATGSATPAVAAVEHFHFVQYGVISGLFYRAWRPRRDVASFVLPCAAALICGVAEEWWQWFLPARVGELQDVLLNAVAVWCGLLVSVALAPVTIQTTPAARRSGLRASTAGLLCVIVAVAAFTWTVHVGYAVEDADIGMFRSRYSATTLHTLSVERAARWAVDPPLIRRTLAREDQYRSEGEAHVRARNTAWDAGEVIVAWKENLILEKYYAPVLDTPSHISATGHRWHPDHRADAARRAQNTTAAAPFVSAAAVDTKWVLGS